MEKKRLKRKISGDSVPAYAPQKREARLNLLIVGEAPGRLGADYSGLPFWGDRAGDVLWGALKKHGYAIWESSWEGIPPSQWPDGGLKEIRPKLSSVAITNAYNQCPSQSETKIKKPTKAQIRDLSQSGRLFSELQTLKPRLVWVIGQSALFAVSLHVLEKDQMRVKKLLTGGLLEKHATLCPGLSLQGFEADLLVTTHCSPLVVNSRFGANPERWLKKIHPILKKYAPEKTQGFSNPSAVFVG